MRKGLLTIILIALSGCLYAQQIQVQGHPNMVIKNKGAYTVDSALNLPVTTGNTTFYGYGNIRINKTTRNLEYRKNNQWVEVGTSSQQYFQTGQQWTGLPVGAGNYYVLDYAPVAKSSTVMVNGVALPVDWFLIVNKNLSIIHAFYDIDSTDIITIKYSYHN